MIFGGKTINTLSVFYYLKIIILTENYLYFFGVVGSRQKIKKLIKTQQYSGINQRLSNKSTHLSSR